MRHESSGKKSVERNGYDPIYSDFQKLASLFCTCVYSVEIEHCRTVFSIPLLPAKEPQFQRRADDEDDCQADDITEVFRPRVTDPNPLQQRSRVGERQYPSERAQSGWQ